MDFEFVEETQHGQPCGGEEQQQGNRGGKRNEAAEHVPILPRLRWFIFIFLRVLRAHSRTISGEEWERCPRRNANYATMESSKRQDQDL
jgi:hypothetical protein